MNAGHARRCLWGIFWLAVLGGLAGFLMTIFCRYPTDHEVQRHYQEPDMEEFVVDSTQADIGFYGVTMRRGGERQQFFIETFQQWVWPWQRYNWDIIYTAE